MQIGLSKAEMIKLFFESFDKRMAEFKMDKLLADNDLNPRFKTTLNNLNSNPDPNLTVTVQILSNVFLEIIDKNNEAISKAIFPDV